MSFLFSTSKSDYTNDSLFTKPNIFHRDIEHIAWKNKLYSFYITQDEDIVRIELDFYNAYEVLMITK